MAITLTEIEALFARRGGEQYSGEPVTQLQHALQTAQLAEQSGADAELITAALLHDLGHLLNEQGESPSLRGVDDLHQYFALPFLRGVFSDRVLQAIQWHVDAKRYLCATRADYWASLSDDSKRSLVLQGGVFSDAEAQAFIAKPNAKEAVQLRLWDDQAKEADRPTPTLAHYLQVAKRATL
jgi:phosphonate degradation associated HDIG domain protein